MHIQTKVRVHASNTALEEKYFQSCLQMIQRPQINPGFFVTRIRVPAPGALSLSTFWLL